MKKIFFIITLTMLAMTACDKIPENISNEIKDSGTTLPSGSIKDIVTTNKKRNEVLADTIINLTAYGREHISGFVSDNVLQIIAVAEESPQDEFNYYYEYSGDAIGGTCTAFDLDAIYVKVTDGDGKPMFEVCFTADNKSYLIGYDYLDQVLLK